MPLLAPASAYHRLLDTTPPFQPLLVATNPIQPQLTLVNLDEHLMGTPTRCCSPRIHLSEALLIPVFAKTTVGDKGNTEKHKVW